jgi:hypothetical protein
MKLLICFCCICQDFFVIYVNNTKSNLPKKQLPIYEYYFLGGFLNENTW